MKQGHYSFQVSKEVFFLRNFKFFAHCVNQWHILLIVVLNGSALPSNIKFVLKRDCVKMYEKRLCQNTMEGIENRISRVAELIRSENIWNQQKNMLLITMIYAEWDN